MKISLYTITLSGGYYDGPAVPLLEIFPKARAFGYDGVEIEAKRPHGSPMDLDAAARKDIRAAADDTGLEISCVGSYNDFSSPIDEHRENELLMVREQIRLAADLGSPIVRLFAAWSGVTRRDWRITYDLARRNIDDRWPGTTPLEKWNHVRDCLAEAADMAAEAGVTLALQNHSPIISHWQHMLEFIREVNSPALKACLDAPLMSRHNPEDYRDAIAAAGELMVHTHFGGRYVEAPDGRVEPLRSPDRPGGTDYYAFMRAAREIINYRGHTGYELCSPVLTGHKHEGLDCALQQAELACRFMRQVIDSL